MRPWLLAAMCVTAILAVPAAAVDYRFDVIDPDAQLNGEPLVNGAYAFVLPAMPTPIPGSANPLFFVVNADETFATASLGYQTLPDDVSFFVGSFFGGFATRFGQYEGVQLFTGTTDQPTFKTGPFTFTNSRATLTISLAANPTGAPRADDLDDDDRGLRPDRRGPTARQAGTRTRLSAACVATRASLGRARIHISEGPTWRT